MNAPDTTPEIKAEAARSLLERMYEKNALVRFFRWNASAKHGVPVQDREFDVKATEQPNVVEREVVREVPVEVVKEVPVEVVREVPSTAQLPGSRWGWAKNVGAALIVAGAAAAGAGVVNSMMDRTPRESPLQYIEDQGEHLP